MNQPNRKHTKSTKKYLAASLLKHWNESQSIGIDLKRVMSKPSHAHIFNKQDYDATYILNKKMSHLSHSWQNLFILT